MARPASASGCHTPGRNSRWRVSTPCSSSPAEARFSFSAISGVDREISAEHAAVTSHNTGKQKNAARKRSIQPPDFKVWNREKSGTIGLDKYVLPETA